MFKRRIIAVSILLVILTWIFTGAWLIGESAQPYHLPGNIADIYCWVGMSMIGVLIIGVLVALVWVEAK